VKYRKPVFNIQDRDVPIGTLVGKARRLPFGTTLVDNLSPANKTFSLDGQWFNGRTCVLTPVSTSKPGIKILQESSPPRLQIDLSWPEFGVAKQ
jgi:hypothetical protein